MGNVIRVLLAGENTDLRRLLSVCLEREGDTRVVGVTSMGREALALAAELTPDVLVMGAVFTDIDRTDVLEGIATMDEASRPAVVVLSDLLLPRLRDTSTGLRGPSELQDIITHIRRAAHLRAVGKSEWTVGRSGEYGLTVSATRMLGELGVPTHLAGYYYLRDAAVMTAMNVSLIGAVTKELYPAVAKAHGVTSSQVERALRTVIEYAWASLDEAVIWKYFGPGFTHKPSNSEFISVLADRLYLQRKYVELMLG